MDEQQWKTVEDRLSDLYNPVELECDGYRLQLTLARISAMQNAIMLYVNGKFKGKWVAANCEERRRFLCPRPRYLWSKRNRDAFKKMGKKTLAYLKLDPDKKIVEYSPYWTSVKRLRRHLEQNNQSIILIEPDKAEAA